MMDCLADGSVEAAVLDMLGRDVQEGVILRLRAGNRAWRDQVRPRLLENCAAHLESPDAGVRLAAVAVLVAAAASGGGDGGTEPGITVADAVDATLKGLEDPSPDVRRVALRTLAHVAPPGDPHALWGAARHLEDAAWPVRWAAVDAVAKVAQGGERSSATALLTACLRDYDWPVRRAAAGALAGLVEEGDDGTIHEVSALLLDPEEDVRAVAAEVLARLAHRGDQVVVTAIKACTGDRSARVRRAAAAALGKLAERGDTGALKALHGALRDGDDGVRRAASGALEHVSP